MEASKKLSLSDRDYRTPIWFQGRENIFEIRRIWAVVRGVGYFAVEADFGQRMELPDETDAGIFFKFGEGF